MSNISGPASSSRKGSRRDVLLSDRVQYPKLLNEKPLFETPSSNKYDRKKKLSLGLLSPNGGGMVHHRHFSSKALYKLKPISQTPNEKMLASRTDESEEGGADWISGLKNYADRLKWMSETSNDEPLTSPVSKTSVSTCYESKIISDSS